VLQLRIAIRVVANEEPVDYLMAHARKPLQCLPVQPDTRALIRPLLYADALRPNGGDIAVELDGVHPLVEMRVRPHHRYQARKVEVEPATPGLNTDPHRIGHGVRECRFPTVSGSGTSRLGRPLRSR
jgi:hypothetical protein